MGGTGGRCWTDITAARRANAVSPMVFTTGAQKVCPRPAGPRASTENLTRSWCLDGAGPEQVEQRTSSSSQTDDGQVQVLHGPGHRLCLDLHVSFSRTQFLLCRRPRVPSSLGSVVLVSSGPGPGPGWSPAPSSGTNNKSELFLKPAMKESTQETCLRGRGTER